MGPNSREALLERQRANTRERARLVRDVLLGLALIPASLAFILAGTF